MFFNLIPFDPPRAKTRATTADEEDEFEKLL